QKEFGEVVHHCWNQQIQGHTMYSICQKLKLLEQRTKGIHKEASSLDKRVRNLQDKLQSVQEALHNNLFSLQLIVEERDTLVELEKWSMIHEQ
ncbi:hypothetical protein HAX54_028197, partial [Datura stramonium]|nr:hypothetical protein [Datura stramonium]